jgi:magnesium transporter
MISIFYKVNGRVEMTGELHALNTINKKDIIWVDMMECGPEIESLVEDHFGVEIVNNDEALEIEHSARFIEFSDHLVTRTEFVSRRDQVFYHSTVSFTICKHLLISSRSYDYRSFKETAKKVLSGNTVDTNADVFLSIIDLRIANDADIVEDFTREITDLSAAIITEYKTRKNLILKVNTIRENLMMLMQNCIDKKLMISLVRKTSYFDQRFDFEIDISVKDLESVIDYIRFNMDRIDYIDRTLNNLITYDQNSSIKLFTIISLFFMPPMLIASIYGMNFHFMPELDWKSGYYYSLILMLVSVIITAIYFKRKRWL